MLKLGPFSIEHPFILAPMAGITHSPFRRLMRRLGSSLVISELISAQGIEHENRKTRELLTFHPEERPVGFQIFGESEAILCRAARVVEQCGVDFVDLNLGCPVTKVVQKGAGAALCRDLGSLSKILTALVKSVSIPVTIKIRTGWDAQTRNAAEVIRVAQEAGVAWVAVHGRTRAQGYQGKADWDFLQALKRGASLPVLGNGDLSTPERAYQQMKASEMDAVLIGRGALRNPFFFQQVRALWMGEDVLAPGVGDFLKLLELLQGFLEEVFPASLASLHARKFVAWAATGFPGCHEFRGKLFRLTEPSSVWEESRIFFEKSSLERDFQFLSEDFLMGGHG